LALAGYSFGGNHPGLFLLALIWIGHIGMDRMLGFGLKYPTRFKGHSSEPGSSHSGDRESVLRKTLAGR
jgi:hypothetical protein